MKLDSIFDQLTYGELAQVYIGGGEDQGITLENRKQIVTHIDLGLTELHKRFLLREGRVTITLQPGISTYVLNSQYAESNTSSLQPVKYLADSTSPFEDNLLKIERVYDAANEEVALNDLGNEDSVHTPTHNTLRVPVTLETTTLTVVYRQDHPTLDKQASGNSPETVEVDLPMSHLEPLLLFVASRVLNPIGLANEFHEGNNYAAKFEAACQRIENLNYRIDSSHSTDRFMNRGWV